MVQLVMSVVEVPSNLCSLSRRRMKQDKIVGPSQVICEIANSVDSHAPQNLHENITNHFLLISMY